MDIRSLPHHEFLPGKRPAAPWHKPSPDDQVLYTGPGSLRSYTRPHADTDVFVVTVGVLPVTREGKPGACITGLWHSSQPDQLVDPTPAYPAGLTGTTVWHYAEQARKAAPTYRTGTRAF